MFGSGFVSGQALLFFGCDWRGLFSHAFTGQIDAIGIVYEAIQDGIGQS